eukprot:765073-Hanusia_phi.AAC.1
MHCFERVRRIQSLCLKPSGMQLLEPEKVSKALTRRGQLAAASLMLLVAGILMFLLFTFPNSKWMLNPQGVVLHIGCDDHGLVFNATASASPEASSLHDIALQSAVCNLSLLSATSGWLHLLRVSVQGPVNLMGKSSANQSLRGDVNLTSAGVSQFSQFLSGHGDCLELKLECSLQIKAELYWGMYQAVQHRNLTKILIDGQSNPFNQSLGSDLFARFLSRLRFTLFHFDDLKDFQSMFVIRKDQTALVFRPRLPVLLDDSGLVSAVYVHVPEVSFDVSVETLNDFDSAHQRSKWSPSRGFVRIGTLPTQWLVMTEGRNGSSETRSRSRTRGNFFITCAQGHCSAKSVRPLVQTFANYLTTHPISAISITLSTSATSGVLFQKLFGGQNSILFRLSQRDASFHRRMYSQAGAIGNETSACFEADIIQKWKLVICDRTVRNAIPAEETPLFLYPLDPYSLPSLELTLAEIRYFVSKQGNPLVFASADVVQLSKINRTRAKTLLGFVLDQNSPYSTALEDSLSVLSDLRVEVRGAFLIERSLGIDIGSASVAGTGNQDGSSLLFAILRLLDRQGAMEWEWVHTAARRQLIDLNQVVALPLNWTLSSMMQTSRDELYTLSAALLVREDGADMAGIQGLVSAKLSTGSLTIFDGSVQGHVTVGNDQIRGNLVASDKKDNTEKLNITFTAGSNQPFWNGDFEGLVLLADLRWKNHPLLYTEIGLKGLWTDVAIADFTGSIRLAFKSAFALNLKLSGGGSWPQISLSDGMFDAILQLQDRARPLLQSNASLSIQATPALTSASARVGVSFKDETLVEWTGSLGRRYVHSEHYTPWPSSYPDVTVTTFDDVYHTEKHQAVNYSTSLVLGRPAGGGSLDSSGGLTYSTYYHSTQTCNWT